MTAASSVGRRISGIVIRPCECRALNTTAMCDSPSFRRWARPLPWQPGDAITRSGSGGRLLHNCNDAIQAHGQYVKMPLSARISSRDHTRHCWMAFPCSFHNDRDWLLPQNALNDTLSEPLPMASKPSKSTKFSQSSIVSCSCILSHFSVTKM